MTAPDDARCEAMTEFLNTFTTISSSVETFSDLSDGVVIFEALSEISPTYFDPTTIARHLGDNWVLKSSNLRKLVRNLESFFHDELKKDAAFRDLDVSKMARESDVQVISELIELVAAAAVTCPDKGTYVSRIMNMSPDAQVQMKDVLESSLGRLSDYDDEYEQMDDENELLFGEGEEDYYDHDHDDDGDGKRLFGHKNYYGGDEDLEEQLAEAKRELAAAKSQAVVAGEESDKAQNKLRAVVEDLQDRLVKRQDELVQVEDDFKNATMQLEETKAKLAEAEDQKTQLADDLDVANAKSLQLHKAEALVVAMKKKLDSVGTMNQQMTDLEDQAASYVRQIMELENEVKKSQALQKLVNELQGKIADLEKHKTETATSSKTATSEIVELKSQLQAAVNAKKMFEQELTELRARQDVAANQDAAPEVQGLAIAPQQTQEQREKTMRLEIENKKLQEEVAALKEAAAAAASAASAPAPASGTPGAPEVEKLKQDLAIKEKENAKIRSDKDKLEAYTKRTLAKFQDKYLVALQECKAKLKEKQDKIESLESRSASERTAQKREERLLSSTIYELGLGIMQNRLKSGAGTN